MRDNNRPDRWPGIELDERGRWKAALEQRGETSIALLLESVGPQPTDILPLDPGNGPDPPRAYVEAWLQRKADWRAADGRRRFLIGLWLTLFTFGAAVLTALDLMMKWLKARS